MTPICSTRSRIGVSSAQPAANGLCGHYKTTLNATNFKKACKRRNDMVKAAMDRAPADDKDRLLAEIMTAIRAGGLFSIDVDIVPTQIGKASHVWLPAATSGEKFDPNFHQAMFEVPDNTHPVGAVVQVLATGWVINERLLRPAMVGVSKAAEPVRVDTKA